MIDDLADEHRADLDLQHMTEVRGCQHCDRPRIAVIDLHIMHRSDRIDRMQFAGNTARFTDTAVIRIAVAVIVVRCQAENQNLTVPIMCGKMPAAEKRRKAVISLFDPEMQLVGHGTDRQLRVTRTNERLRRAVNGSGLRLDRPREEGIEAAELLLSTFEQTVASGASEADIIEKIDIGGISLIRAAAKNFKDVVIVPSKAEYSVLLDILNKKGAQTDIEDRKMFATRAFGVSSHYDTAIHSWFEK